MNAFYVSKCKHGWGVFASRALEPGEVALRLSGRVVPRSDVDARGDLQANPLQVALDLFVDLEYPGLTSTTGVNRTVTYAAT